MNYRHIAIEGNIGSGKTTLATMLSQHFNARLILEEFEDNGFLPKFYDEPERYAFPLELSFLADRYKQLKQTLLQGDLFSQPIISDYLFIKSKLFAKINLNEDEYELFQKLFDIIDAQLPDPELLIFLQTPISKLQQNIRKRGRSYEQQIANDYLEKVEGVYQQYLKQQNCPILFIETAHVDFIANKKQFKMVVDFLEGERDFEEFYLKLPTD